MLVTFTCEAHEDVTMFGDVALRLLKMMGQSGTIPSAITAEDVPQALSKLREAIAHAQKKETTPRNKMDDDDEQEVSIAQRAFPLIELLENAAKKDCAVMWDKA